MDIKIGYKKNNGETSGTIIRIDNDGFIYLDDYEFLGEVKENKPRGKETA